MATPGERRALLDKACAADDTLRRLQALIDAHVRAGPSSNS